MFVQSILIPYIHTYNIYLSYLYIRDILTLVLAEMSAPLLSNREMISELTP